MIKQIIFYSCSGEGLGHVSRCQSVIDAMPQYEFHVFTFGKAYKFLKSINYPYLHEIDGLMFSYRKGKVNYWKTTYNAIKFFISGIKSNIKLIKSKVNELKPDLFISDFEPSMPRAANALNKKFISIDNQHRFAHCSLKDLPYLLRVYCYITGIFVKFLVPNPYKIIISTFNYDYLSCNLDITVTNGLLRNNMDSLITKDDGFILFYLRESISETVLKSIADIKFQCKIYGATDSGTKKELSKNKNIQFCELSPKFIDDLVSCKCIIANAGNQLITEARFYSKPILAIPEPGQYEQYINAFYVNKIGMGVMCYLQELSSSVIKDFINNHIILKSDVSNGVYTVTKVIESILDESS